MHTVKFSRRLAEAEEELARVRGEAEDVRQNRSNVEREVVEAQARVRELEEASQGQEGLVLELRSGGLSLASPAFSLILLVYLIEGVHCSPIGTFKRPI